MPFKAYNLNLYCGCYALFWGSRPASCLSALKLPVKLILAEGKTMGGAFEGATRAAIAEIIKNRSQESKFGIILSPEAFEEVVSDLFDLLQTSRTLKATGDRMLAGGGMPPPAKESKFFKR